MDRKDRLLYHYNRVKKSLLVILVFMTFWIGTIPSLYKIPGLFEAFIISSVLLFLEMFFSLCGVVNREYERKATLFTGITSVLPAIFTLSRNRAKSNNDTLCQILASTGTNVFPYLRTIILEEIELNNRLNMSIELYMMDPAFSSQFSVNGDNHSKTADLTIRAAEDFKHQYQEDLKLANVNISCHLYKFTPMIHGFLINDNLLYLSHFHWRIGLEGAHNRYKLITGSDDFGKEHMKCFKNWLQYARIGETPNLNQRN